MSENKTVLKTGDKQLDADLKELFEILGSEKLNTIKKAIANKEISIDDFAKVVPESLIRLSYILTGARFNLLVEKLSEDSIPLITKAKSLIEKHFENLFENKSARSILKKTIERDVSEDSLADKSISGVGYYRVWIGSPPELTPAVQMGFKNNKGKILWDVTLDWDDLSFLLEVLTRVLDGVLDKGKSLAENEQIDLSDSETIGERIRKSLETFENIKKLAPIYKIKIESGSDSKKKQKTKKKKRRN